MPSPEPSSRPAPDGAFAPDNARNGSPPPEDPGETKPAHPSDVAELVFPADAEPTDDTPTVISRGRPQPAATEDVFIGMRGRKLAHFELIEPIGVGGMAAVIRARDLQLDRQVALKILPPEMAADEENVRRFHQEARAAARLDHENIARVYFCGEDQKLHFIAFEFVEGENLRTILERRGRLPIGEAIKYMLFVATGLAHAAQRGVIHRDIKPSNIIISPNGRAKLVDMGLARQVDIHPDHGLTQSGVTLGTFDYISPEQALEPRDADIRSDIYSLGCTFYHAITGQAPVPEGTAAKKLHHHQHIAPVDPRQLNSDIPDEVAAILARMMAKQAKDRYQRAEHLVQHLMQATQKLGLGEDWPEGALFVDAPLPSPPRPRPVLLGIAAACALLVLIFFLGQAPLTSTKREVLAGPPSRLSPAKGPSAPSPQAPNPADAQPPEPARPDALSSQTIDVEVRQAKDLAGALRSNAGIPGRTIRVLLANDLDLEEDLNEEGPGFVYNGGKDAALIIEARSTEGGMLPRPPTIRLNFPRTEGAGAGRSLLAALTVKSGTVVLRGLRFVVDAHQAVGTTMAAVCWQGGSITVEHCEFVQARPSLLPGGHLAAVEIAGPGTSSRSALTCNCCSFFGVQQDDKLAKIQSGGQYAFALTSTARVDLSNCAFGPHAALFAFQGKESGSRLSRAQVKLDHCSALLTGDSTVVRLDKTTDCRVILEDSLISHPEKDAGRAPGTSLVRQIDEEDQKFVWKGQNNRYHNLGSFWVRPDADDSAFSFVEFQNQIKGTGTEEASQLLATSPWLSSNPLALLDGLDREKLQQAFQVNDTDPDLRLPDASSTRLVGVEQTVWSDQSYVANLKPLTEKKTDSVTARKTKVVDPAIKESGNGTYPSLSAALEDARPGDEILIHHNGLLPVKPLKIKSGADVTIRPHADFAPILTLADTRDEEAALFSLEDGKVTLQQLSFLLRPANSRFRSQAVVLALGDGECAFKDCVITLDALQSVPLAAVSVADPPGVMKMMRSTRTAFSFQNCFIRGDGDLVSMRAGRPLELELSNALLALTGSCLSAEGALADDTTTSSPAPGTVSLRLSHVTSYLQNYLVRLHALRDLKGLPPVHCQSVESCLFLSAAGKSLIHLDGPEASLQKMQRLLTWQGQHNAYSNFPYLLDQKPNSEDMSADPYNQKMWKEFTNETDGQFFPSLKLAETPGDLARALPGKFRVKIEGDPMDYGVEINQLLKLFGESMLRSDDK
jgi:serine/threonine protein kinase